QAGKTTDDRLRPPPNSAFVNGNAGIEAVAGEAAKFSIRCFGGAPIRLAHYSRVVHSQKSHRRSDPAFDSDVRAPARYATRVRPHPQLSSAVIDLIDAFSEYSNGFGDAAGHIHFFIAKASRIGRDISDLLTLTRGHGKAEHRQDEHIHEPSFHHQYSPP